MIYWILKLDLHDNAFNDVMQIAAAKDVMMRQSIFILRVYCKRNNIYTCTSYINNLICKTACVTDENFI